MHNSEPDIAKECDSDCFGVGVSACCVRIAGSEAQQEATCSRVAKSVS